jgi:hypothetical protein
LATTSVTGPGSRALATAFVRGPKPPSNSRIASGEKYMTAEGLPSSRPFSRWIFAIAPASSGSQASP